MDQTRNRNNWIIRAPAALLQETPLKIVHHKKYSVFLIAGEEEKQMSMVGMRSAAAQQTSRGQSSRKMGRPRGPTEELTVKTLREFPSWLGG